jgi:hypothetical protein
MSQLPLAKPEKVPGVWPRQEPASLREAELSNVYPLRDGLSMEPTRASKRLWIILGVVALLGLIIGGGYWASHRTPPPASPTITGGLSKSLPAAAAPKLVSGLPPIARPPAAPGLVSRLPPPAGRLPDDAFAPSGGEAPPPIQPWKAATPPAPVGAPSSPAPAGVKC